MDPTKIFASEIMRLIRINDRLEEMGDVTALEQIRKNDKALKILIDYLGPELADQD